MSATRSLRNRSSRYSSPATFSEREGPSKSVEIHEVRNGQQGNLDRWIEPPVRHAVASFEDTKGLERLGVLEHMAPLGAPPTQKLLQKLKVNLSRSNARATSASHDEGGQLGSEISRAEAASPANSEYIPVITMEDRRMTASSPPRGRPAKRDADEMRQGLDITTPSPVKGSFSSTVVSPRPQSIQEHLRQDRMKNVFDRAIDEARKRSDHKLVPGLQQLFEDAKSVHSLWVVLDAVLNKTPTDAQFTVFKRYIKKGVRRQQRDPSLSISPLQHSVSNNRLTSPRHQAGNYMHSLPANASAANLTQHDHVTISPSLRLKPRRNGKANTSSSHHQPLSSSPTKFSNQGSPTKPVQQTHSSPMQRRRDSMSSLSSLSSAPTIPDDSSIGSDDDGEFQATAGTGVKSLDQRQASNPVAAGSRPSIVNPSESSHSPSTIPASIRFVNKKLPKSKPTVENPEQTEALETKKRELIHASYHDYNTASHEESNLRPSRQGQPEFKVASLIRVPPPPVLHPHQLQPFSSNLLSPDDNPPSLEFHQVNSLSRKRPHDEFDMDDVDLTTPSSSSPAPSLIPPPPETANYTAGSISRAGRLPPLSKARKSARVMISPNKPKNGGVVAGVSHAGSARDNAAGDGLDTGSEDNDEFCASCSGEGILLCCDGCTNSFHHACLEPPLNPDAEVDGEWYCPRCIARRNKEPIPEIGIMSRVIRQVDDTIPKAFSLPLDIREYFEGVKTGDEGEYEDVGLAKSQNVGAKMNRAGFFEQPNYKEPRDSKNNIIFCYHCGKSTEGRDIIPCDYCPAKWHTDCLNPPLAVPPQRRGGDKPTGYWRCPLHIDDDLTAVGRQPEAAPGDLGRLPRLRRPKKAIPVDVDITRGFRNNGVIEVELMKDEMPNIKEVVHDHGIYRLPEKGIRLDFIDRVKRSWYEDQLAARQMDIDPRIRARLYRPDHKASHPPPHASSTQKEPSPLDRAMAISVAETAKANVQLRHRTFKEQSAALTLLGITDSTGAQMNSSVDPLANLTNALVACAPTDVETSMNNSEVEQLLRLKQLINERLSVIQPTDGGNEINGEKQQHMRQASKVDQVESHVNGIIAAVSNGDTNSHGNGNGADTTQMSQVVDDSVMHVDS